MGVHRRINSKNATVRSVGIWESVDVTVGVLVSDS